MRQLGAFARTSYDQYGRGSVILNEEDLIQESGNRTHVGISYLPRSDASPLWEYEAAELADELDPAQEFLLTSVQSDGQALSMILEAGSDA